MSGLQLTALRDWLPEIIYRASTLYVLGAVVGGSGLAILLSRRGQRPWGRFVGALLFMGAALYFLSASELLPTGVTPIVVWLLSLVSLLAGLAMVTSRKPMYSAIWFAVTLLGVGGLFFVAGAQFLGVATVAVYAGAIVVTFLFVLMLSQPEGQAAYDRMDWGTLPRWSSCLLALALCAYLLWTLKAYMQTIPPPSPPQATQHPEHVASLGAVLFSRYLMEVELAGALLLAALVGAVAIASQRPGSRGMGRQLERALDGSPSGESA